MTPLTATVTPKAMTRPIQGSFSKARPPRRPMKNAYSAQKTAATAVAGTNLRRG
jgi:hypothetical protein